MEKTINTHIISEEEYLASKGYGFNGIGNPALHKGRQKSARQQEAAISRQLKSDREYTAKRSELRKEYRTRLENGELREPTLVDKLVKIASGHPDLECTRAAERALLKRGFKKTNGIWQR